MGDSDLDGLSGGQSPGHEVDLAGLAPQKGAVAADDLFSLVSRGHFKSLVHVHQKKSGPISASGCEKYTEVQVLYRSEYISQTITVREHEMHFLFVDRLRSFCDKQFS